ncbi:MAG: hypothetical protein ABS46_09165 [Cytophagaceae bacterium SCN 52-12]|nr:MAG: hypothetical protein ABS46_09165 [Cytophagaceae bacterium SCN 52-12]
MKTAIGLRCKSDYTKKNGYCALYLRVVVNGQSCKLPLKVDWPAELVNEKDNELKPRRRGDQECADYNLLVRNEISKANQIFVEHRLSGEVLTIDKFLSLFKEFEKRKSFLEYMTKKMNDRYRRKKISEGTWKSHRNCLIWLKNYKSELSFAELTPKFIENFEYYLSRQANRRNSTGRGLDPNTIANVMKYIKAYINIAINKDRIPIINPFHASDVKTSQNTPEVEYLNPEDVRLIMGHYVTELPVGDKISIVRFLIACILGLRISDILKISEQNVEEWKKARRLAFHPKKQMKTKKLKTIYLPLEEMAIFYLEDYMLLLRKARLEGKRISEAYSRKTLRKVTQKLGILGDINYHTGRHTFATNYLRAGGKLTNLQQILGHSNINTTMIYAHIVDADKEEELGRLASFYMGVG